METKSAPAPVEVPSRALYHLTMDTRHVRESPRSEVSGRVVKFLQNAIRAGKRVEHSDGITDILFRVPSPNGSGCACILTPRPDVSAAAVMVVADGIPVVDMWLGYGDDGEAWDLAAQLFQESSGQPAPTRPTHTPWLAVTLLSFAAASSSWLGDFERCLAWTLLSMPDIVEVRKNDP